MKSRIHVNQHSIRANAKDGGDRPVITVKRGRDNLRGREAELRLPDGTVVARVVYADGVRRKPLSCGAKCWIESDLDVAVTG